MSHAQKKCIVLLDSHAILHRAYHALPDFVSPTGEPTGALYGLATFVMKVVEELRPDHLIAAYDLPEPTHRHEAYAAYKGTRQKTDDALVSQLVRSRDLIDAFGIPRLEVPGYEADDILGTLARAYAGVEGVQVVIASGDMDTLQLVTGETVVVYTLKKGLHETTTYTAAAVRERYGFGPEHVADYKGLRGDPSDNIPGIRGVGEKTATLLVSTFGSIESMYDTLTTAPERFREAGLSPRIIQLLVDGEDEARFSKELATIRCDVPLSVPSLAHTFGEGVRVDVLLSLCAELGFRSLVPKMRTRFGGGQVVEEMPPEAPPHEDELLETTLALWIIHSETTNPTLSDVMTYTGAQTFHEARAKILHELHERDMEGVLRSIELPLTPLVRAMESRGILLDVPYLETLSKRYHHDLDTLAEGVHARAGVTCNLNSPRQLGDMLFDTLRIGGARVKKTATGQRSTSEETLKKYAKDEPIIADILEYRELQKLLSTYIDALPKMVDGENRLHARFSQSGTTTGRMSSQHPNMQNIPIKSTRGSAIRRAIIAPSGFSLLCADYSQIELRIAAFLSGDEKLIECFKSGQDIHTAVAAQVFGVPHDMVDKEMRRRAKAINFGILYGMGAPALALATDTTRKEAQAYLDEYFKRFAGIRHYVDTVKAEVHSRGYTQTWFGRRRYFEGVRSPLPHLVAQAERMALNAPIQGTQADIIKIAMVRINTALEERGLKDKVFLTCQIHDELMYEVRDEALKTTGTLVREVMEAILSLEDTKGVPLKVDVEVGKNWGEMVKE